jgi:hypothetical protein
MLDDDKVTFIFVSHAQFVEEQLRRLAHHHGAEELAAQPGSSTRGNASLNDGDLEVGALSSEHKGGRQAARSSTDNDNVGLGVRVKVGEVTAGWLCQSTSGVSFGAQATYSWLWKPGSRG